MRGIVKWFHDKKGYGFIVQEGGGDLFVHHTGLKTKNFKPLKDGDKVIFDIQETEKGPEAINVDVVSEMGITLYNSV